LTSPNKAWRSWFEDQLKKKYEIVGQYDSISYIGMTIRRDPKTQNIMVDQHGYLESILRRYGFQSLKKYPATPSTDRLTVQQPDSQPVEKTKFLSLVMALMYLARFTRPDIHMSVAYLATRASKPTEDDLGKLHRVLKYLAGTRDEGLCFMHNIAFHPVISADASHHLYSEGHGQAGMTITNGSAPVGHRSAKIKMITRSSSESELVALEDASTYAIWYSLLLSEIGLKNIKPITIFQDNKSTIIMAVQGGSFRRTKHLIGRESFVREKIRAGDIKLKYLPKANMMAHLFTKPLGKNILTKLKQKLCVVSI
jgi:hypothetical protein